MGFDVSVLVNIIDHEALVKIASSFLPFITSNNLRVIVYFPFYKSYGLFKIMKFFSRSRGTSMRISLISTLKPKVMAGGNCH